MRYIGKSDRAIYSCVTSEIATDDVIITAERIQHIKDHHPGHFEVIEAYLQAVVAAPDYILKDTANTGLILKQVKENGINIQAVIRLHTTIDAAGFKNSIISAWKIREKEYRRLIRNKTVLYRKE